MVGEHQAVRELVNARSAEEVRQGLHDKKTKAKTPKAGQGRKPKSSSGGPSLAFGDEAPETSGE